MILILITHSVFVRKALTLKTSPKWQPVCELCRKINWDFEIDRMLKDGSFDMVDFKIPTEKKIARQLWGIMFTLTKTHDHSHLQEQVIMDSEKLVSKQIHRIIPNLDESEVQRLGKDGLNWWSEAYGND